MARWRRRQRGENRPGRASGRNQCERTAHEGHHPAGGGAIAALAGILRQLRRGVGSKEVLGLDGGFASMRISDRVAAGARMHVLAARGRAMATGRQRALERKHQGQQHQQKEANGFQAKSNIGAPGIITEPAAGSLTLLKRPLRDLAVMARFGQTYTAPPGALRLQGRPQQTTFDRQSVIPWLRQSAPETPMSPTDLPWPAAHPLRAVLHNEIHARPPEAMAPPLAISHLVMVADAEERHASRTHLAALLRDHHLPAPGADCSHLRVEFGGLRLRWELHTEFVTWSFSRIFDARGFGEREPSAALAQVPRQWLAALPGRCIAGMHLWVLPGDASAHAPLGGHVLREDTLVGSLVAEGHGEVFTDFALHADGFSRMVLMAGDMAPRRLGRLVQQLLEIDSYRMMALLALPVARDAFGALGTAERELASLAEAIRRAGPSEEPALLDRLTQLAGDVEGQYAATHSRFSAAAAYFELVDRRIVDIGESRLPGLQTLGEFVQRRLSPARSTCEWAARRQDALSQRVSRISNLLRTRVEIEQQESSQKLLGTMNRRQRLQLKLQSTVEGLSVAAITYYIVGLVSYLAKGAQGLGWPWAPETTAAAAIPLVALGVWGMLRRLHASVKDA